MVFNLLLGPSDTWQLQVEINCVCQEKILPELNIWSPRPIANFDLKYFENGTVELIY